MLPVLQLCFATLFSLVWLTYGTLLFRKKWTRNVDSFDARAIFKQFGSEEWGEYLIPEAHLSQRFMFDENGYYHCCASIPFPKNMPVDWSIFIKDQCAFILSSYTWMQKLSSSMGIILVYGFRMFSVPWLLSVSNSRFQMF